MIKIVQELKNQTTPSIGTDLYRGEEPINKGKTNKNEMHIESWE